MNHRCRPSAMLIVGAVVFLASCGPGAGATISSPEANVAGTPASAIALEMPYSIPLLQGGPNLSPYQSVQAGNLEITLVVSPGTAGDNDISLFFFDKDDAVDLFVDVQLSLKYLDFESRSVVVEATMAHSGHAFISGRHLAHSGRWQIEAVLRRSDSRETRASFEVQVN